MSAEIKWHIRLTSSRDMVYRAISTDEGRAGFWAESAIEIDGFIEFVFPNGQQWKGRLSEQVPGRKFAVEYIGGGLASFYLEDDGKGGTLLTLKDEGVTQADVAEVSAGWVSVLMALKAAVDHGIDLRNHDQLNSWDKGYVDN